MALELSEKEWKLAFSTGAAQKPRRRDIPARDIEALRQEIATAKERFDLPAETRVVSCYEAGRDGFWLHRFLLSAGVGAWGVEGPCATGIRADAGRQPADP